MSKLAVIGLIIGSAALFVVLSGFNGLKEYTLAFSSIVDPDIRLIPKEGKTFTINDSTLKDILSLDDFLSFSKVVEERVFISTKANGDIITAKGVSKNYPKKTIDSILYDGDWISGQNQIVSGWSLANSLSYGNYDYSQSLKLYVPKPGNKQILSEQDAFKKIDVVNVGRFEINEALDFSSIFLNLDDMQNLLSYSSDQFSYIDFLLNDPSRSEESKNILQQKLGGAFQVKTKKELNETLYKMLNTEEAAVYLIFTLVLIIALFNLISSIIMMVLEKKNNLKTLYSSGATHKQIKNIFYYQGLVTTLLGGFTGLLLGVLLVWCQKTFSLFMLTPGLAYPVKFEGATFLIVSVTILLLGVIASKVSSRVITKSFIGSF